MCRVDMLLKAKEIAFKAHKGQVDKSGVDYFEHPKKVATFVEDEKDKIVAYLHDVVEDTSITLEDLRNEGFDEEILFAIDCITKREKEDLMHYLNRVIQSSIAYRVKLADMKHNADVTRFKNPTEKDYQRSESYKEKAKLLKSMFQNK